ncbi:MAG TPA: glycerophosphodiester phosphodiesterase, partial [Candidatus Dormibacteraeota bacterium]|nr:glycerophosphodiester phosphodiesterase [Candidatus Dormibacteraeota bacterium]
MSQLIGFAHRGGARPRQLQNTLAAFRRSLEMGATGVESDVALTADGVPVLIHPGLVARLRRPVSGLRRDQLPAHVPTVEEVYRELGSRLDMSFDMGAPAAVSQVVAIARRHGDPSRLWLTYWRLDVIRQWRRRYPDVRLVVPHLWLRSNGGARTVAAHRAAGVDALNLY